MDFLDKVDAFLLALNEAGINFSNQDGETAVVCNDCVAVVNKQGNEIGVNFINQVERFDFTVGFTQKDVEEFMMLEEFMGGEENAGD